MVCSVPIALDVSLLFSLLTCPVLQVGFLHETALTHPIHGPYIYFLSVSLISSMYIPSPIFIEFLSHLFLVAINPMSAPYLLNSHLTATAHIAMPILLQIGWVRNRLHFPGLPPSCPLCFPNQWSPFFPPPCWKHQTSSQAPKPSPLHSPIWTFVSPSSGFHMPHLPLMPSPCVYLEVGGLLTHFPASQPYLRHL